MFEIITLSTVVLHAIVILKVWIIDMFMDKINGKGWSPPPYYSSTGLADAGTLPIVAAVRYPSCPQSLLWGIHHAKLHVYTIMELCISGSAHRPACGAGRQRAWPASTDWQTKLAIDRDRLTNKLTLQTYIRVGLTHARPNYRGLPLNVRKPNSGTGLWTRDLSRP